MTKKESRRVAECAALACAELELYNAAYAPREGTEARKIFERGDKLHNYLKAKAAGTLALMASLGVELPDRGGVHFAKGGVI